MGLLTKTLLVIVTGAEQFDTVGMLNVAVIMGVACPDESVPTVQERTPFAKEQSPPDEETKVIPAGGVSTMATSRAAFGPALMA